MLVIEPLGFLGLRYWSGRYVLTTGFWYWNGRFESDGHPGICLDPADAKSFVSARHAYSTVESVKAFQQWKVRRVGR